jgi:hypothetical protein
MHQIFGNVRYLEGKSLRASETLVFEVYTGCNGPGRIHTRAILVHGTYGGWNDEGLCLSWCQALG